MSVQVGKPSSAEVRDIAGDLFEGCLQHNLLASAHVERLLDFHQAVITAAERRDFGRGTPAEFNLRDLIKVRPGLEGFGSSLCPLLGVAVCGCRVLVVAAAATW